MTELTTEMVRIGHVTSAESDAKFKRWIAKVQADALRDAAARGAFIANDELGRGTEVVGTAWLIAEAAFIEMQARLNTEKENP